MPMLTQAQFEETIAWFERGETLRAQIYPRALALLNAGFEIEAHLLLLATWNFAAFRYVMRTFDLQAYQDAVESVKREVLPLAQCELMSADLHQNRANIVAAFDLLARFKGIQFTGAAKILHLLNREVFVMWDRFISGQYSKRCYLGLDIVAGGFWPVRKFPCSGVGYFEFLVQCQKVFRPFRSPNPHKTLAKCIDEFNYRKITVPLMEAHPRKRRSFESDSGNHA